MMLYCAQSERFRLRITRGEIMSTPQVDWAGLRAGRRVSVARRLGIVMGLRLERGDVQLVYVQYDDGYAQWVPMQYVEVL